MLHTAYCSLQPLQRVIAVNNKICLKLWENIFDVTYFTYLEIYTIQHTYCINWMCSGSRCVYGFNCDLVYDVNVIRSMYLEQLVLNRCV